MGSKFSKKKKQVPPNEDFAKLAAQTPFDVCQVEALYELYKKLSSSLVNDGYIQKEELFFALFRSSNKQNLFADRIFDLFDVKQTGHIDFGEFVHFLSIFIRILLKLRKLHMHLDYIEHEEMVLAFLTESDLTLSDDIVEAIVDKTFKEADINSDGRIDQEEWKLYTAKNPLLLRNMTLSIFDGCQSDLSQLCDAH